MNGPPSFLILTIIILIYFCFNASVRGALVANTTDGTPLKPRNNKRSQSEVELGSEIESKNRKLDSEQGAKDINTGFINEPAAKLDNSSSFLLSCFLKARDHHSASKSVDPVISLDDPAVNYFDKIIRYALGHQYFNYSSEEDAVGFWESDLVQKMDPEWCADVFFFLINYVDADEDFFIEYFRFVIKLWRGALLNADRKTEALLEICNRIIEKDFSMIFDLLIDEVSASPDGLQLKIRIEIMTKLSKKALYTPTISTEWIFMCKKVIEKFPEVASEKSFRIPRFAGTKTANHQLFIHFLPVMRMLMVKTEEELEESSEEFGRFELGQMGDLSKDLPTGLGGLNVIASMFLYSGINLTAFARSSLNLRVKVVERVFDAVLLEIEGFDLFKLLFESKSFSMWEAYLKYRRNLTFSPDALLKIVLFACKNLGSGRKFNFLLALIAYYDIPDSAWEILKAGQPYNLEYLIELQRLLSQHKIGDPLNLSPISISDSSSSDSPSTCSASSDSIALTFGPTEIIDNFSEMSKYPCQYDLARIFLARTCGIPIGMTNLADFTAEGCEWKEVVGFINFHVKRIADKSNSSTCIKFTPASTAPV